MKTVYHQMAKRGSGRKHLRTLIEEQRTFAERNGQQSGFNEKFHHPRHERPWGMQVRAWRKAMNLVAKEAAAKLDVPFGTYRGWEAGYHIPGKPTQREIERRMKDETARSD